MSFGEFRARFNWHNGECFKCERVDVPVTPLGVLEGSTGAVAIFSCTACTRRLEGRLHGTLTGTHQQARRPLQMR